MKENVFQYRLNENFSKFKDNIAVEYGDTVRSYAQLDRSSGALARWLLTRPVEKGMFIGILADDRVDFITAVLGVLKARCVFVALDSGNPAERLRKMVISTGLKMILTDRKNYRAYFPGDFTRQTGIEFVIIEDIVKEADGVEADIDGAGEYGAEDEIYIYFTSGSTGMPHAVLGKNKSLLHYIRWEIETFAVDEHFRVAQLAAPGFDAFLKEVFVAFLSGGTLCIPENMESVLDSKGMADWLEQTGIHLLHCVPSLFRVLNSPQLEGNRFPGLKYILFSGEKIFPADIKRWYEKFGQRVQLVNLYGATESTILKTYYLINQSDADRKAIPIGKAMKGARVMILDENLKMCNTGIVGEIYIRSPYLTFGYYNDPVLTKERFIKNPFTSNPGDFLYKTGDLGRRLDDGNIELLGRIDRQVKIRGTRIELEEIENTLLEYRNVIPMESNVGPWQKDERFCKTCLLTSGYPGISFDEEGVCNICREYERYKEQANRYFKEMEDFAHLVAQAGKTKKGEYDCLLLYSGGKDSSYVLYRLVDMGLKVLTFTFDNGYISAAAFENIKSTASRLNVENIVYKIDNMNDVFVECLRSDHTVCTGCFKALTTISTRVAYEKGINVVITGLSKGQIFETKLEGLFKKGIFEVDEIERQLRSFRRMYHSMSDRVSRLLDMGLSDEVLDSIYFVDYFRYDNTTIPDIRRYLSAKGWSPPADTGFCSTNCIINDVGIYVHLQESGYHNYAAPLSWDCRLGLITREQGLGEVEFRGDMPTIARILEEIGYTDVGINDVALVEKEDQEGNSYLCAYFVSPRELPVSELREYLSAALPEYMVPAYFVQMEKMPLLSNGKLDMEALPDPVIHTGKAKIGPRNEIEEKLLEAWAEVLHIDKDHIGVDSNFFELGGHSLNVMSLISIIHRDFDVRIPVGEIFNNTTIEKQGIFLSGSSEEKYAAIPLAEKREYYEVSSAQKRMYFMQLLDLDNVSYNMTQVVVLAGRPEGSELDRAFRQLIGRHENLCTAFEMIGEERKPVQRIHDERSVEFEVNYYRCEAENNKITAAAAVQRYLEDFVRPFDLSRPPLLRAGLVKASANEENYVLVVDMHHIISDGRSNGILAREFKTLLNGGRLPCLKLQYKDYSQWQNSLYERTGEIEPLERQEQYWLNRFEGEIPVLDLPTDFAKSAVQTFEADSVYFEIGEKNTAALKALVLTEGVTLYMLFLALCNVLLSRLSGQEDIVVGVPVAGRRHADMENIIGFFVNTLPLRNFLPGEKTFLELLKDVKENTLNAFENQDYPLEELVEKLNIPRDINRNPLFDVTAEMVNADEKPGEEWPADARDQSENRTQMHTVSQETYQKSAPFDLDFFAVDLGKKIIVRTLYRKELFKEETIQRFVDYFKDLVSSILEDNLIKLKNIKISHDFVDIQPTMLESEQGDFGF